MKSPIFAAILRGGFDMLQKKRELLQLLQKM